MHLLTLFFITMENNIKYLSFILIVTLTVLASCSSSQKNNKVNQVSFDSIHFYQPSYSFYHISGHFKAEYRIAERGLRDSFVRISNQLLPNYFPGKSLTAHPKTSCMDYKMHVGNIDDERWKVFESFKCLEAAESGLTIHFFVMFEDFYGSTIALSNPPSESWVRVRIIGFVDTTIVIDKSIRDAVTISHRKEEFMLKTKGEYNPYFPSDQIQRVMNRVFAYLQKQLPKGR